jgi:hypothetical protein
VEQEHVEAGRVSRLEVVELLLGQKELSFLDRRSRG